MKQLVSRETDVTFVRLHDGARWINTPNEDYVGKEKQTYRKIIKNLLRKDIDSLEDCIKLPGKNEYFIRSFNGEESIYFEICKNYDGERGEIFSSFQIVLSSRSSKTIWNEIHRTFPNVDFDLDNVIPEVPYCVIVFPLGFRTGNDHINNVMHYVTCLTWAYFEENRDYIMRNSQTIFEGVLLEHGFVLDHSRSGHISERVFYKHHEGHTATLVRSSHADFCMLYTVDDRYLCCQHPEELQEFLKPIKKD